MALAVSSMIDYVFPPLREINEPTNIHKKFCELICEYINKNVEITYKWTATNSEGRIDPITFFKTQSKEKGYFELSGLNNANLAMKYWCLRMSNVIKTDMEIIVPDTWVIPKLTYGLQGLLNITMNGEPTFQMANVSFCSQFIQSFKTSFINSIAIPGIHILDSIYTGTAVMTSIS